MHALRGAVVRSSIEAHGQQNLRIVAGRPILRTVHHVQRAVGIGQGRRDHGSLRTGRPHTDTIRTAVGLHARPTVFERYKRGPADVIKGLRQQRFPSAAGGEGIVGGDLQSVFRDAGACRPFGGKAGQGGRGEGENGHGDGGGGHGKRQRGGGRAERVGGEKVERVGASRRRSIGKRRAIEGAEAGGLGDGGRGRTGDVGGEVEAEHRADRGAVRAGHGERGRGGCLRQRGDVGDGGPLAIGFAGADVVRGGGGQPGDGMGERRGIRGEVEQDGAGTGATAAFRVTHPRDVVDAHARRVGGGIRQAQHKGAGKIDVRCGKSQHLRRTRWQRRHVGGERAPVRRNHHRQIDCVFAERPRVLE